MINARCYLGLSSIGTVCSLSRRLCCSMALSVIVLEINAAQNELVAPQTLIEGVVFSRSQIPASFLHLRAEYQSATVNNDDEFLIVFENERRMFCRTNHLYDTRSIFTSTNILRYQGGKGSDIEIHPASQPPPEFLFDPRVLGISAQLLTSHELLRFLDIKRSTTIELAEATQQQVSGTLTWHVRMRFDGTNPPFTLDLWIDPAKDFRVMKSILEILGLWRWEVDSVYENASYPWLPSKTISKAFRNGQLDSQRTISVISAISDYQVPKSIWSVAGLNAPAGVAVVDNLQKLEIGTWDGQKVVPLTLTSVIPAAQEDARAKKRFWGTMGLVLFLVAPIAFIKFAKRSKD